MLEGKYDRFVITGTNQDYATWMTYDRADRLVATAYPSGDVMTTTYNNANQPVTLRNQTPRVFVTDTIYNPMGQPTKVNLGNTQSNRYYYYGLNAPTVFGSTSYGLLRQTCVLSTSAADCSESQRAAVTPTLLNLTYAYDFVGNVTAMDDRTRGLLSTFSYDEQDRLTSWTLGGVPKESYGYNPIGNLTSKTGLGTMTYTDTAHVHALTKVTSGLVATYDANGNMLQRWTPSSWFTQTWNIFNQITRTVSAVTPTLDVRYFYDADNQLIRKLIGGAHTIYIGNYYEKNLTTRLMTQYYYFGGRRISMRVGTTVTSTVTFLHGDHLGSASVETNDSYGVKLAEMRYSPFGETYYQSNLLSTDKLFTGQRQEAGFGVYDYGARFDSYIESSGGGRMYSPLLGRFISPDPIVPRPGDPQALNRYMYARSNPMTRVDGNGHADEDPQKQSLCQALPILCAPSSPPATNEVQMGDAMSVQQVPVVMGDGSSVTFFAAKSGNEGKGNKGGGIGGWIRALLQLLGGGGGAGAGKAGQKLLEDGDPTNEAQALFKAVTVADNKLGYLLKNDIGKAKGFEMLGFSSQNSEQLRQVLISAGQNVNNSNFVKMNQYGATFNQTINIVGPNGVAGRITVGWQIDTNSSVLRLITAIPQPFK